MTGERGLSQFVSPALLSPLHASPRATDGGGTASRLIRSRIAANSSLGTATSANGPERTLRHSVLWRKSSGGTDSPAGRRFAERMLSVVATCRQQNRNVLEFLTACCRAWLDGSRAPSLLPGKVTPAAAA